MTLWALLHLAWRNLFAHRQRMLLVWGSVGGSTALLVVLLALDAGATRAHRKAVTTLLSGDLNVGGYYKVHPDTLSLAIADAPAVEKVVAGVLPKECRYRERGRGHVSLRAGKYESGSFMVGVEAADEAGERELFELLGPRQGSLRALAEPGAVALSGQLAEQLHVQVGDLTTFYATTTTGKRNALDGKVVAITENVGLLGGSSGVVTSNAFMQSLYGYKPGVVGVLQLRCPEQVDVSGLGEQVRQALKQAGFQVLPPDRQAFGDKVAPLLRESWKGQRLDVSTWEDEVAFLSFVTQGVGALTLVLEVIVLAVTIGGLFLSLSMAVRERTREIGTLRALGMQRRAVVGVFVLEGLLTGLLASAVGAVLAALVCRLLDRRVALPEVVSTLLLHPTLLLEVQPARLVQTVALISFGAALGAVLPAARAAFLPPRAAMESIQ